MNPVQLARIHWRARKLLRQAESCLPAETLRDNWKAMQMSHGSKARPFAGRIGNYDWLAPTYDDFEYLLESVFLTPVRLPKLASEKPSIIDAGAHVGFVCLYFKLWYPNARLLCFEPTSSCFNLLEQNIKRNHLEGVTLHRAACGKEEGELTLFIAQDHSLASSSHKKWDSASATETARVVRLSGFIDQRVDLLKMNVEGAEWDIMDDLIATGKLSQVDNLMVAYHHRMSSPDVRFGEFLRYFEENGYVYELSAPFNTQNAYGDKWQSIEIYARKKTGNAA